MPRPRVNSGRILDAGAAVLARSGEGRLTIVDVAAEAGISRHTVGRRYSSPDALLAAVAEHLRMRVEQGIRRAIDRRLEPRQQLVAVATAMYDLTIQSPFDRFLDLQPHFYLTFVREHFEQWVCQVAEALETRPTGPDLAGRLAAAEFLVRHVASYQIVAPRDRSQAIGALVEGAGWLLEDVND